MAAIFMALLLQNLISFIVYIKYIRKSVHSNKNLVRYSRKLAIFERNANYSFCFSFALILDKINYLGSYTSIN